MAMRCVRILIVLLFFISPTSLQTFAQQVTARARVSSNAVQVNQPFLLEYALEGNIKSYELNSDLLKDFEILDGPIESSMNSFSFGSGSGGIKQTKTITIQYTLAAKRAGNLSIPAVKVTNSKGEVQRSNNVAIIAGGSPGQEPRRESIELHPSDLTADKIDQNLFIVAEVDNTNPFVGQQVNVTYKLYTILQMSMSPTSKPQLNGFWAYDENIPEPNEPHQENYKGHRYNVFILRKTALFPQQSGHLIIDPIKASGWVLVKEPDFWGSYQDTRVNAEVQNQPITIDVKPLPVFDGNFSGGVGQFTISQKLNKSNFNTDDIIQLTLSINGNGNIGLIAAPNIALPEGLSAIAPEIKDEITEIMPNLHGYRQFTYNISADAAGSYTIPAIAFSYYDTKEQQYQTIYSNPTTLQISEGKGNKENDENAINSNLKDVLPIKTQLPSFQKQNGYAPDHWYYWALFLASLIGTFVALRLLKNKSKKQTDNIQKASANVEATIRLTAAKMALSQDQHTTFFEEISKAIWLYLSEQLKIPLSQLNKDNVKSALTSKDIDPALIQQTIQQIETCEMALYTPMQMQERAQTLSNTETLIASFENYFNSQK